MSLIAIAAGASDAAELYARYRADSGIMLDSSNVVTQWVGVAGAEAALDRVIGEPSVLTLGNSSSPATTVARFDGASSIWAAAGDWGSVGGDRTVVAHLRLNDGEDGFLFDGSTNTGMTRAQVAAGQWQVGIQPSGIENASNPDPATTAVAIAVWQTHIFEYDFLTRGFLNLDEYYMVRHYIDGLLVGENEIDVSVGLGGLIVGANVRGQEFINCDLAELAVYDNLFSEAERAQVLAEIDARWGGLYDLPARYICGTALQNVREIVPFGLHDIVTLAVEVEGSENPFALREIAYNLVGSDRVSDIAELRLYFSGANPDFDPGSAILMAQTNAPSMDSASLACEQQLGPGLNYIHIVGLISESAVEGSRLDAGIESFTLDGSAAGVYAPATGAPVGALTLAAGFHMTAIRRQGDDGVHTYRIPGLATSTNGTLIAVFDIRHESSGDLPGDIDVGLMRSTDGGASWGPMQTIMDYDETASGSAGNGAGDPAVLVDRQTGRIWVAALWSFGDNGWSGSGTGLSPEETGQYVLCYSDDDGLSWSEPCSITDSVKDPNWRLFFQGPGKGFSTRDGVLIFPSQYKYSSGVPRANFIWSDDQGATWNVAPPAIPSGSPWTTEAQMVELDSGDLLISMRNHDSRKERLWCVYSWDHDSGTISDGAWGTAWFAQRDPICMASVEAARSVHQGYPYEVLVFSNPDNSASRVDMTIKLSFDGGLTWPYQRKIDDRPAAYSCLTVLPNGDIGILYETGDSSAYQTLTFARFPLGWVTGSADSDGDGIPDHYEDATGLDKSDPTDGGLDSDGDGSDNYSEFKARTHPRRADSILRLGMTMAAEGMALTFPSVPFLEYSIETSLDLRNWSILNGYGGIVAADALTAVPASLEETARYYRVRPTD